MRKRLGCMFAAVLLALAFMHAASAAEASDAGRIREDALTITQLSEGTGTVLGSNISRADIATIEVLDSLECTPAGAWDCSAVGDGSVMAWVKDGTLTIAANGGVKAPRNASGLFANYTNATAMRFNGCFDTSDTENMYGMFIGCSALQTLDITGFDTSAATNMAFMFSDCGQLKALDVSGFDTSRVEDMNTMFQSCSSLEALDVSGFDTSHVTALDFMFYNCSKLKALDVTGFDTQNATTLKRMFYNCSALQKVRVSRRFVVGNCVDAEDMFTRSNPVIERDRATMTTGEWLNSNLTKTISASLNWPRLREDAPSSAQFDNHTGTVLGSEISRDDILSIEFRNSLEDVPEGSWDVSAAGDGSVQAWVTDGVLTIAGNGGVRAPESAYLLFSNYSNATSIRFNGCFDTYETYNMTGMFYGCGALQTLDIDGFDTSGVKNMAFMFSDCGQLKALDLSGFDTARVEDMNTMFQSCASLETLDVSCFDTSRVTAMDYMFNDCAALKRLDISGFDTNRVTTLKHMFYGCTALEEIRVGRDFAVADGADTRGMFTKTTAAIVSDGVHMTPEAWLNGEETPKAQALPEATAAPEETGADTGVSSLPAVVEVHGAPASRSAGHRMRSDALDNSQLSNASGTVLGSEINRKDVVGIEFRSSLDGAPENAWDASEAGDESVLAWLSEGTLTIAADGGVLAPVDSGGLFANYINVEGIRFNDSFDTSGTTSMYAMFSMDSSLKALDVSWMDTSGVTNMFAMFNACNSLASLNISGFDTRNVENMGGMFYNCAALEALDISGFDTSNVTDMNGMFRSCDKLKRLDVSGFDTSNVVDMTDMFYNCGQLEALDLSSFNTAGVTSMNNMFCQCAALERIVFTGLDLSNVTDMECAFSECESLTELRVGSDSPAAHPDIRVNNIFDQSPRVAVYSKGERLTPAQWLGNETAESQTDRNADADATSDGQTVPYEDPEPTFVPGPEPTFEPTFVPGPEPTFEPTFAPAPESASDDAWAGDNSGMASRMRADAITGEEAKSGRGTVLGSGISRGEVQYITFADNLENVPSQAWDVSEAGDGSVWAWINDGVLTIAGRGGVNAPLNATGLFANYTSLKGVSFNGSFLTAETTDMSYMFYGDGQLMALNCSGFDTSRVQSMRGMFCGCSSLETLDVSRFETGSVTDMQSMFAECRSLTRLDVSRFNTGSVQDFSRMFMDCTNLDKLLVSDAFVALGDPAPETGSMLTNGPLHIQNGDAVIDPERWQQILQIASDVKKGVKGSSVEWIQRILTKLGYMNSAIDGDFGKKTQNALMEFQRVCGLEPSGVADDGTLKALARQALD